MSRRPRITVQPPIPTFGLYGEGLKNQHESWLHSESIAARSALHDWEIRPHRHRDFFQILYIGSGSAEALLGETRFALQPPILVLVPARVPHGYRFSRDIQGHVLTAMTGRAERLLAMAGDMSGLLLQAGPVRLPLAGRKGEGTGERDEAADIAAAVAALAREFAGSAEGREAALEAHLLVILLAAWRLWRTAQRETGESGRQQRLAMQLQALIDRDFRQQRRIGHYAAQLGVSETHLNRISRAAFGLSALGLLNRRLLREAERDLTFTMLPVKAVALSLGFEDPAYFSRFFAKHTGITPMQFRRRQG